VKLLPIWKSRQLCPLGQNRARELRVCGAITAPSRNGGKGTKERALHRRRRRAELNHVTELQRKQRQLQWMRHALAVRVTEAGETEYRLNHVSEALAGRYLNPYAGVLAVARVPPVVPHAGLDDGGFTPTEDTSRALPWFESYADQDRITKKV
jgi:hypothetical protein